eukprot:836415_1
MMEHSSKTDRDAKSRKYSMPKRARVYAPKHVSMRHRSLFGKHVKRKISISSPHFVPKRRKVDNSPLKHRSASNLDRKSGKHVFGLPNVSPPNVYPSDNSDILSTYASQNVPNLRRLPEPPSVKLPKSVTKKRGGNSKVDLTHVSLPVDDISQSANGGTSNEDYSGDRDESFSFSPHNRSDSGNVSNYRSNIIRSKSPNHESHSSRFILRRSHSQAVNPSESSQSSISTKDVSPSPYSLQIAKVSDNESKVRVHGPVHPSRMSLWSAEKQQLNRSKSRKRKSPNTQFVFKSPPERSLNPSAPSQSSGSSSHISPAASSPNNEPIEDHKFKLRGRGPVHPSRISPWSKEKQQLNRSKSRNRESPSTRFVFNNPSDWSLNISVPSQSSSSSYHIPPAANSPNNEPIEDRQFKLRGRDPAQPSRIFPRPVEHPSRGSVQTSEHKSNNLNTEAYGSQRHIGNERQNRGNSTSRIKTKGISGFRKRKRELRRIELVELLLKQRKLSANPKMSPSKSEIPQKSKNNPQKSVKTFKIGQRLDVHFGEDGWHIAEVCDGPEFTVSGIAIYRQITLFEGPIIYFRSSFIGKPYGAGRFRQSLARDSKNIAKLYSRTKSVKVKHMPNKNAVAHILASLDADKELSIITRKINRYCPDLSIFDHATLFWTAHKLSRVDVMRYLSRCWVGPTDPASYIFTTSE